MPVDGTYGRLSAHNQRVKDLRRRRTKKSRHTFLKPIKIKRIQHEKIDSAKMEEIKLGIRNKLRSNRRQEYLISFIISLFIISAVVLLLTS